MRCCVCGWADADQEHELGHLKSQYHHLIDERARLRAELAAIRTPRGGHIVIHAILQVARGIVRPVVTLASVGAVIAAVFVNLLPAEALLVMATACLAWWFKERGDRRQRTPTES